MDTFLPSTLTSMLDLESRCSASRTTAVMRGVLSRRFRLMGLTFLTTGAVFRIGMRFQGAYRSAACQSEAYRSEEAHSGLKPKATVKYIASPAVR